MSIVKNQGRAFEPELTLKSADDCVLFPKLKSINLLSQNIVLPDDFKGKVKLVCLSFKHFGFTLLRSWLDPLASQKWSSPDHVTVAEICFIEHAFLSITKNAFISGLKPQVPSDRLATTVFTFGGSQVFARELQLPNVFTGYIFLLDSSDRVRWRACGRAKDEEIRLVVKLTEQLLFDENSL